MVGGIFPTLLLNIFGKPPKLFFLSKHSPSAFAVGVISGGWQANWGLMRPGWERPFPGIKVKREEETDYDCKST